MAMIRPKGKAAKVAQNVMKKKGVRVIAGDKLEKTKLTGPYLQH
jgi:hypothetical protein